ncbi:ribonuclease P protein subunit p21 [Esox lucius]|uniref:Ribonuclease P protein subunit p21 n=1 Tax=Esox lucius TaxID=8010 RepID=C1BYV1_ESOLU|nr:ribonuclease P protein subunit p21 [Esox lucius]ACO14204.1 Ribonuclease P protein subunit p21 [Esox lucius]
MTTLINPMASNVKDKEAYQRLNFLYQAAHCVLSQTPENVELARFYCFTQKTVAKRLVIRQDPSVKRTLCKKCCSLLVPGVTATVRQRSTKRKKRLTVLRCISCGQTKTFLNNLKHCLWVDQPEAQLENESKPEQDPFTKELQNEKTQISKVLNRDFIQPDAFV